MNTRLICDEAELATALKRLEEIWGASLGSLEGDELESFAIQVEKFEAQHYPLSASNPTEAIEFGIRRIHAHLLQLMSSVLPPGQDGFL